MTLLQAMSNHFLMYSVCVRLMQCRLAFWQEGTLLSMFRVISLASSPRLLRRVRPAPEPMALMQISIQKLPERKHLTGLLSLYVSADRPAERNNFIQRQCRVSREQSPIRVCGSKDLLSPA